MQVGRLKPEKVQMLHNVAHQGDPADSIYIVASGALKARRSGSRTRARATAGWGSACL